MPSFQCTRCPRSSLVKSNFKFKPDGECICIVCWEKPLLNPADEANFLRHESNEREMMRREHRHAGERFE